MHCRHVPLTVLRAVAAMAAVAMGGWFLGGCTIARRPGTEAAMPEAMPILIGFTNLQSWSRITLPAPADSVMLVSPLIETRVPWNELVVSWNIEPAAEAGISVAAHLPGETSTNDLYRLGDWSANGQSPLVRTSHRGQKGAHAEVKTDTLVLRHATQQVRLQLQLHGALVRDPTRLRLVTASFCNTALTRSARPARREVWGTTLDVPERSQVAYADGRAWCSPTSVSMILAWWSRQEHRPDLDRDVPEVAHAVHDPGWPGTGNWPFNMAYAGSFPGIRACAARLQDLRAVEDLIAVGIPVVLSVNAPALRGKPLTPDGGHLVICVGFTESGDVVANDPWARLEEGQRVRRVYPRANVERAWSHAHGLAYLVAPADQIRAFPAVWR
ncbi:MAG: C39 family peptidase [Verrucomicrobiales bacterium]|nr:C39 family peptidase [Verrucomicrobiales bacterium]